MIAPGALAGIHVFFPDPWPKKRHHKRRLLQPAFVALAASRLVGANRKRRQPGILVLSDENGTGAAG